jgi:hypothetical protein
MSKDVKCENNVKRVVIAHSIELTFGSYNNVFNFTFPENKEALWCRGVFTYDDGRIVTVTNSQKVLSVPVTDGTLKAEFTFGNRGDKGKNVLFSGKALA